MDDVSFVNLFRHLNKCCFDKISVFIVIQFCYFLQFSHIVKWDLNVSNAHIWPVVGADTLTFWSEIVDDG